MATSIAIFATTLLLVSVLPFCVLASGSVGVSDLLEPHYPDRPYVDVPTNTTEVSEKVQREVVLSCYETSPVFRACNCDILSWDSCGNIYGEPGEEANWAVTVTNMLTNEVSRLVSPIMFLRKGVARFYFTPTTIGPYNVSVVRTNAALPALYTDPSLSSVVLVHDVTATCSQRTLGEMLPQFQDTLWAHSQFLNEQSREGASDLYSVNTHINVDKYGVYNVPEDGVLQQNIRRKSIQPYKDASTIPRQAADDNNMHMCDMIRHTYF